MLQLTILTDCRLYTVQMWSHYQLLNKLANNVPCDIMHRLYRGVLYFQTVIRFHATCIHVISFTPTRKLPEIAEAPHYRNLIKQSSSNPKLHAYMNKTYTLN